MTALHTGDIVAFHSQCYGVGGKTYYYVEDASDNDAPKLIEISDWSQDRADHLPATSLKVVSHIDPLEILGGGDGRVFPESARELLKEWI